MHKILRKNQCRARPWLARNTRSSFSIATKFESRGAAILFGYVVKIDLYSDHRTVASARVFAGPFIISIHMHGKLLTRRVAKETQPIIKLYQSATTQFWWEMRTEHRMKPCTQRIAVEDYTVSIAHEGFQSLSPSANV